MRCRVPHLGLCCGSLPAYLACSGKCRRGALYIFFAAKSTNTRHARSAKRVKPRHAEWGSGYMSTGVKLTASTGEKWMRQNNDGYMLIFWHTKKAWHTENLPTPSEFHARTRSFVCVCLFVCLFVCSFFRRALQTRTRAIKNPIHMK